LKERVLFSVSLGLSWLILQTFFLPHANLKLSLPSGKTVFNLPSAGAQNNCLPAAAKHHTLQLGDASFDIYQKEDRLSVSAENIEDYVRDAARAVVAYYGTFPVDKTIVVIEPTDHSGVGFATSTFEDEGGYGLIEIEIGRDATNDQLLTSWTLTHEMMHLAFPIMNRRHRWLAEGIATYVEPIGRMRIGKLSREDVWRDLAENLHKGLPSNIDDGGLNQVQGRRRLYWGGALYCLVADVSIRKQTKNRMGLEDALRAVANMGGTAASDWSAEKSLRMADCAIGTRVLQDLYEEMAESPTSVDIAELLTQLGVKTAGEKIMFDDEAPLASVRHAIESGTTTSLSESLHDDSTYGTASSSLN
jgi:hypothetical protein